MTRSVRPGSHLVTALGATSGGSMSFAFTGAPWVKLERVLVSPYRDWRGLRNGAAGLDGSDVLRGVELGGGLRVVGRPFDDDPRARRARGDRALHRRGSGADAVGLDCPGEDA